MWKERRAAGDRWTRAEERCRIHSIIKYKGAVWKAERRDKVAQRHGRYKGRRFDDRRAHTPRETERTVMLNLGRITSLRFDMKEVMSHYRVEESAASAMMANVIAKGSRISIDSAREFLFQQEKSGVYPKEALAEIADLLDRYSKLR